MAHTTAKAQRTVTKQDNYQETKRQKTEKTPQAATSFANSSLASRLPKVKKEDPDAKDVAAPTPLAQAQIQAQKKKNRAEQEADQQLIKVLTESLKHPALFETVRHKFNKMLSRINLKDNHDTKQKMQELRGLIIKKQQEIEIQKEELKRKKEEQDAKDVAAPTPLAEALNDTNGFIPATDPTSGKIYWYHTKKRTKTWEKPINTQAIYTQLRLNNDNITEIPPEIRAREEFYTNMPKELKSKKTIAEGMSFMDFINYRRYLVNRGFIVSGELNKILTHVLNPDHGWHDIRHHILNNNKKDGIRYIPSEYQSDDIVIAATEISSIQFQFSDYYASEVYESDNKLLIRALEARPQTIRLFLTSKKRLNFLSRNLRSLVKLVPDILDKVLWTEAPSQIETVITLFRTTSLKQDILDDHQGDPREAELAACLDKHPKLQEIAVFTVSSTNGSINQYKVDALSSWV